MVKATKRAKPTSHTPARTAKPTSRTRPTATRPGGKLGLIVDRLSEKRGATADELVDATGWQRHSVLGALSKLKSRGFEFDRDSNASRKAYRLTAVKG